MDTFCIIYEHIGNAIFAIFGLFLSAIIISTGLTKWIEELEGKMRERPKLRLFIGLALGAFCIVYILVSIRDGIIQIKESSPLYQAQALADEQKFSDQMKLKGHVQNFAQRLYAFGSNVNFTKIDDWKLQIDTWKQSLNDEGVISTNLDSLLEQEQQDSLNDPRQGPLIKAIALELGRMADTLPNNIGSNAKNNCFMCYFYC